MEKTSLQPGEFFIENELSCYAGKDIAEGRITNMLLQENSIIIIITDENKIKRIKITNRGDAFVDHGFVFWIHEEDIKSKRTKTIEFTVPYPLAALFIQNL